MARVSGKDTKPEILLRRFLFSKGFRFRKNDNRLPGRPDVILPKHKTVVLVHGCFWHGHKSCKASKLPESNKVFWEKKINRNVIRDRENAKELQKKGWKTIVVWQCEIKTKNRREQRLNRLVEEMIN